MASISRDVKYCYAAYSERYDEGKVVYVVNELKERFNCFFRPYLSMSDWDSTYNLLFLSKGFHDDGMCIRDAAQALLCCQRKDCIIIIVKLDDCRIPEALKPFTCIDATIPNVDLPAQIASALKQPVIRKKDNFFNTLKWLKDRVLARVYRLFKSDEDTNLSELELALQQYSLERNGGYRMSSRFELGGIDPNMEFIMDNSWTHRDETFVELARAGARSQTRSVSRNIDPWVECIARREKNAADELIEEGVLPNKKVLIQVCNEFGRKSKIFSKVCNKISEYIRNKSTKIVDVWASYRENELDEHGGITKVYFVVFTKNLRRDVEIMDYDTTFRCVTDFSKESEIILEHELSDVTSNIPNEQEIEKKLRKSISEHADKLMDDHSNVSVISPSLKRSIGYRTGNYRVLDEPCIAIYVHVKGLIPIQEDPLPVEIEGYYVDVLEGEFNPFAGRPNDFHNKLKMGLAIHANIVDKNGDILAGTLGGFLDHPEHGLCGVTCAHVVSSPDELTRKGSIFHPTDRQVFQPVGVKSKPFGNVVCIINDNGDELRPGMEVAVVQILERHPENGSFPIAFNIDEAGFDNDNPLTYNSGEVREASEIRRRTEVFKFGMASGMTRGSFGLQGSVVRKEEMQGQRNGFGFRLKNQMVILQIGQKPFAENGDSGALALIEDIDSGSVAIGIVEGGINGRVFVTPICDILRAFNCTHIRMKQFNRRSSTNHMWPSASVSSDSGISWDVQMDVGGS